MIGISKLYCGSIEASDNLRYGETSHNRPVVVFNCTQRCNLKCVHCYAASADKDYEGELSTAEARALLKDLADFGCPVVLFSGGEPLLRPDIFELIQFAAESGVRSVLSTNGTLITEEVAEKLKTAGVAYVGVSLDGVGKTNDEFRRVEGAYEAALRGIRNARDAGIKVGIRFTITRRNVGDVKRIFQLAAEESVPRICFYHLVYAGRGSKLVREDLTPEETRKTVDTIIDETASIFRSGDGKEVLTVDNHADGAYLYLRLLGEDAERARKVYRLLEINGGNSSGVGIGCVDSRGDVHADQFWRHYSFGNVRERPFSEIWQDTSDPLMAKLKEKKKYVGGRCGRCRFLDICAGNSRVRAEAVYGDVWAEDPACYLTDEEIGIK